MPWFMASIQKGVFEVLNPYSQRVSSVPAAPHQVHSIVFWSKNFGVFLQDGYGHELTRMGYRFFFNFTINSANRLLEPEIPPLETRLDQLSALQERYGPDCIHWRFDPICHLRRADGGIVDNLEDFHSIARHAASLGISTCITSFVDLYRKVYRRTAKMPDIQWADPPLADKVALVVRLAEALEDMGIRLKLCCERGVIESLPASCRVGTAACIPSRLLVDLYGGGLSLRKDPGQRAASGCGCGVSRDIGSYAWHPCAHNCLFCYARPSRDVPPDAADRTSS